MVLVIAGPTIVAKSPLRNVILSKALPALAARDASFSWLGSQALAGVVYADAKGTPLFRAELVQTNRSLIGLASNRNNLGTLTLTRPVIQVDTRAGGSNIEDLIAQLAEATAKAAEESGGGSSEPTTVEVQIVDGTILGRDLNTGQQWRIEGLAATAKPTEGAGWDVTAAGVMSLGAPTLIAGQPGAVSNPNTPATLVDPLAKGDPPGRFKLHLVSPAATAAEAPARQTLQLIADRLPLAPLEPWLARVLPEARITGDASADLNVAWNAAPPAAGPALSLGSSLAAAGKIDATNLRFTAAAFSGDLLELPAATMVVDAGLAGNRLTARNCTMRSDWLQADLNGEFNLEEINRLSLKSLPTSDAVITARADLPQLTRMLPRTLRLRPGVRVDAGMMEVTARSANADAGRNWTIAAVLQNLVGSDGERPIRWTKPVEVGLDAVDTPSGPQFQRALFRSAFATATADGTAGGVEGEVQFNLAELADQLGQFVDLSTWRLQGTGAGKFSLRDTGTNRFAASAELDLQQIDVQRAGKVVWQDPQVRVEVQTAGDRLALKPSRLETGSVTMRGPNDTLAVELLEPIVLSDKNRSWFVTLTGNGPLESWAGRLRPWVAGVPEQLSGQSTVSASVRSAPGLLQVTESKISIQNFQAQVGKTRIVEPAIEAAGDFRWDSAARLFDSKAFQLSSRSVAFGTRDASVQFAEAGPPTARGDVAFRGDLERMSSWGDLLGAEPGGLRARGEFEGLLKLSSDANRATAVLTGSAAPLQLVNSADGSLAWNEPRVELATEIAYTNNDDLLRFSNMRLTGKTVKLEGAGDVEQFRTAGLLRGDVNVTYDAAELATLLTAYLGPNIQITGANQAHIEATGQLYAASPPPSQGGAGGGLPPAANPNGAAPDGTTTWNTTPIAATIPANPTAYSPQPPGLPASHWSRRWQLATQTGWSAANVFGLPIGPAQLVANVRDGQANFAPLELTVGPTGRVSLTPRVLLDSTPQLIEFAPGQVISNVAISAEVSDRMLKYAAPMVAGAAQTEGSFSFFLNQAQIPLRQPKTGRLEGRLTVHNLAVTPGPMIQQIATLISQLDALSKNSQNIGQNLGQNLNQGLGSILGAVTPQKAPEPIKGITMSEKAIDVRVADGRVHHSNLEFLIDDVPVRSNGSVGFDETLSLMIEVPIQAKWVGSKPALQSLVGQVIQIPVGGTFAKPQIDNRAVGNFVAQAAQQAAGGIIGEELNKAFDKILKPR